MCAFHRRLYKALRGWKAWNIAQPEVLIKVNPVGSGRQLSTGFKARAAELKHEGIGHRETKRRHGSYGALATKVGDVTGV
jgi:hypothetical protein